NFFSDVEKIHSDVASRRPAVSRGGHSIGGALSKSMGCREVDRFERVEAACFGSSVTEVALATRRSRPGRRLKGGNRMRRLIAIFAGVAMSATAIAVAQAQEITVGVSWSNF